MTGPSKSYGGVNVTICKLASSFIDPTSKLGGSPLSSITVFLCHDNAVLSLGNQKLLSGGGVNLEKI